MTINFTPTSALADVVYGLDLLGLFNTQNDKVAILNNGAQVFQKARPMDASIREPSRVMRHPAETGVMLSDHQIIDPVEIEMPLYIPSQYYVSTYQEIITARNNATQLQVKTPVRLYTNMIISDMPHKESPEYFNAIILTIKLTQVIFEIPGSAQASPANYSPAAAANQNTQQSGLQQAQTLGTQVVAGASGILSYVTTAKKFF